MDKETEKKLARALGAEDTELLPYLPYLLQDLKNLGTPIIPIIDLIKKNIPNIPKCKVLDLGCGKGSVGLPIAKETGASVLLVDIFPEFIECAKNKAKEMQITNCEFLVEDIKLTAKRERGFDLVFLCSVGNVFGSSESTVKTLKQTVKKGGYIIIEESCFEKDKFDVKCEYDFETYDDWLRAFDAAGVRLVAEYNEGLDESDVDFDYDNRHIAIRARELSEKYPDKKDLFESYVQSQLNECDDLKHLKTSIWLLQATE